MSLHAVPDFTHRSGRLAADPGGGTPGGNWGQVVNDRKDDPIILW